MKSKAKKPRSLNKRKTEDPEGNEKREKRPKQVDNTEQTVSIGFAEKYDQIFHVRLGSSLVEKWTDKNLKKRKETKQVSAALVAALTELLRKGLGNRILEMDSQLEEYCCETEFSAVFGLLLNSQQYMSVLERGPSGDSNEANSFRQFWGEKSELRKFADGGICETVVWEAKTIAEKRQIPSKIVKFLLKRHFSVPEASVIFILNQLDRFISVQDGDLITTGEELNQKLLNEFDKLGKKLRSLTGLPLAINNIQGVAESLRLTEVIVSQPLNGIVPKDSVYIKGNSLVPRPSCLIIPPYQPSLEVQITLESSGSWPNNIEALRHCKTAFYLKMGERLKDEHELVSVPYRDKLLVLQSGYVFSLVLVVPRELGLLKETITETGMVKIAESEEFKHLDAHIMALPKLSSTLKGLALQESSFGPVCRLVKRWLASHMLSDYIQPEAIELLVAHLYLSPGQFSQPQGLINGFLRFLTLLSSHDWLSSPLIVNFNAGLSRETIDDIKTEFIKKRPILPPMCIATPYDRVGTQWTRPQPNAALLERMIRLASACKKTLDTMLARPMADLSFDIIFQPPMNSFDVVIHLLPTRVAKRSLSLSSKFKDEYKTELIPNKVPVVDFDPADCYLSDLIASYESVAKFFYDKYGGNEIGVVWKPAALEKTKYSASKLIGRMPSDDPELLETNFDGIIEHFKFIGKGLVDYIEILKKK